MKPNTLRISDLYFQKLQNFSKLNHIKIIHCTVVGLLHCKVGHNYTMVLEWLLSYNRKAIVEWHYTHYIFAHVAMHNYARTISLPYSLR